MDDFDGVEEFDGEDQRSGIERRRGYCPEHCVLKKKYAEDSKDMKANFKSAFALIEDRVSFKALGIVMGAFGIVVTAILWFGGNFIASNQAEIKTSLGTIHSRITKNQDDGDKDLAEINKSLGAISNTMTVINYRIDRLERERDAKKN